jgi:hypothetical protein
VFYIPVRHFSSNTGSMTSKYWIKKLQRRVDFRASIIQRFISTLGPPASAARSMKNSWSTNRAQVGHRLLWRRWMLRARQIYSARSKATRPVSNEIPCSRTVGIFLRLDGEIVASLARHSLSAPLPHHAAGMALLMQDRTREVQVP